ncbi:thiamine-binding protein [Ekhidna sp. MALMAid0563]|uniref:thiamine-binding protein n=1 Tax=Ekhidna sp. MALMAid0563 TaxID=3143937 RepID=UPI0032DE55D3
MTDKNIQLAIQVVPLEREGNVYEKIDAAIDVIQDSGVEYLITPMETVMQGPYDQLQQVAKDAQQALIDAGCTEFLVNIKMHIRTDRDVTMEEKRLDR